MFSRFLHVHIPPEMVLSLIVFTAFMIRIAGAFHPGYTLDVGINQRWAHSAVEYGIAESYKKQVDGNIAPEYPPVSQLIFASVGNMYKLFIADVFDYTSRSLRIAIKLPAIFADVFICVMLFSAVSAWQKKSNAGLLAAAAYGFHPAAIFTSAVWGQTDAIYTLFLLTAIVAWWKERDKTAAFLLAIALLTKMHAVILVPLFTFLLYKKPKNFLRFTLVGIMTFIVFYLPFAIGGSLPEAVNVYFSAIDRLPSLVVGAYNIWWSLFADRAWSIPDSTVFLLGLSYKHVGYSLFGTAVFLILFACRIPLRKRSASALFLSSALLSAAFFLLLTQMHERYMFPFIVFGIPLLFIHKRFVLYYWVASLAFTMNLVGILPFSAIDKTLYSLFDSLDVFVATTIVWMMLLLWIEAVLLYAPFVRTKKIE
jgi:dolichyl-phosphate-mannose-protein mannosyltransferase